MFENKEVVYGVVTGCSEQNDLTVLLDNGETGIVLCREVTRRELKSTPNYTRMIGRQLGFFAGETDELGRRILSAKAYENHLYEEIVHAFRQKERNVYSARLISTTADGKLAFYGLAQGVNGAVSVSDFASTRVRSFRDILLPREMTVAIKQIDDAGRIQLYGKIGFPDFSESVERMGLMEGCTVEGYVSNLVPDGSDALVTLAPNLIVLSEHAEPGSQVRVKVDRIKHAEQRLKAHLVSKAAGMYSTFRFSDWCVDVSQRPSYMQIDEFEQLIKPRTKEKAAAPEAKDLEISYVLEGHDSPFAIRDGERVERIPLSGRNASAMLFEVQHNYLTKDHMTVAKAVNTLKFTTTYQLQRYLDCKEGLRLSVGKLRNILDRLLKHDIIHALNFCPGGSFAPLKVFYPGALHYSVYTHEPRSLGNWAYTADLTPSYIKHRLSVNQLLLGMLHGWSDVEQYEFRCILHLDSEKYLRPCFKAVLKDTGTNVYAESVRSNGLEDSLEKLKRYNCYFVQNGEKESQVIAVLEDSAGMAAFARQVEALKLKYDVILTTDMECLPAPVTHIVAACTTQKHGFLHKVWECLTEMRAG